MDPSMDPAKTLAFLRVVIATAWADGQLQPQEWPWLQQLLQSIGHDPAIQAEVESWLTRPLSPQDYRQAVQAFVDLHPTCQDRRSLYAWAKQVIYADNEVSLEEAYILDQLGELSRDKTGSPTETDRIPVIIQDFQGLVGRWLSPDPRPHPSP
ncbi:MAG: TerB family tellurite resistance protein [Synechococcaceae cyanobacterium SM2_3_2]|nr:TerB family tellurite resistance protein [Synechococcaceae cyanobacterium SM2_3_2]